MRAGLSPLTTVPWPAENGERDAVAPLLGRDATIGGPDTTGVRLDPAPGKFHARLYGMPR